jgi:hypothetical protein
MTKKSGAPTSGRPPGTWVDDTRDPFQTDEEFAELEKKLDAAVARKAAKKAENK